MRLRLVLVGWIVCSLLGSPALAQQDSPAWRNVFFGGSFTGPKLTSHATDCSGTTAPNGSICVDLDDGKAWQRVSGSWVTFPSGGGAPTSATYITKTADGTLSAEFALGSLSTGLLKNTTTTGDLSIAAAGTDYADPAALNASALTSGTVPDARFPATLPSASGANLTSLNASNLSSGTVAAGRMPALTGDVTTSAGAVATSIAAAAVSNAKLANMAQGTIKGRAAGAGTGDPTDLTATQATAILDAMVGDSGSGGTKGLAPAPGAGDAAAGKYLKANGLWDVPAGSGSGDFVGPASATDNAYVRFDGATGKLGQNGVITESDTGQWTLPDDIRQVFNPGTTNSGLNVGALAGDPSSPTNGDLWYDSTANELTARINGANVALGAGGGGAPTGAKYLVGAADGTLSDEINVGGDDVVPVGSGSTAVATALPSCSNATTSKLLYNTSTNSFSCGTDQTGGGSGGLVLLESHTASSSASVDFTTRNAPGQSGATFQSDFDEYEIHLIGVLPASDGTTLQLTFSSNGGSTFISSGYGYVLQYLGWNGANGLLNSSSDAIIKLNGGVENTTSTSVSNSRVIVYNPTSGARYKAVQINSNVQATDGNYFSQQGSGFLLSTTALDAFRISYSGGNVAEGEIRVYGVNK